MKNKKQSIGGRSGGGLIICRYPQLLFVQKLKTLADGITTLCERITGLRSPLL